MAELRGRRRRRVGPAGQHRDDGPRAVGVDGLAADAPTGDAVRSAHVGGAACAGQREALALLDEVDIAPDLMISDYQLEDGQFGTDAIAALRARFGPLPACLITANRTNAMRDACAESGVTLLHKPLDPGDLRQFLATG